MVLQNMTPVSLSKNIMEEKIMSATLYIKNTIEAVAFYQEAFGMTLGYNEKFPDGTYMHAELHKDGKEVFSVSEHDNEKQASYMRELVTNKVSPIASLGMGFATEEEVKRAYEFLMREGIAFREIGELPWNKCCADVLDKFGVYWYIHM